MNTRGLTGRMWTILILLASALFGECTKKTIKATAGENVLLPCTCPENKESFVVWQIGNDIVVAYFYKDDPDMNKTEIASELQGRTRLFLSEDERNCSLLLRNVIAADKNTYTCTFSHEHLYPTVNVTLEVIERPLRILKDQGPTPSPPSKPGKNGALYAIVGVLLVLALLFTVFLTVRNRKNCWRSEANGPGRQDGEQTDPLNTECV